MFEKPAKLGTRLQDLFHYLIRKLKIDTHKREYARINQEVPFGYFN